MLNALGGGLIGWGAVLLASTLVWPTSRASVAEFERSARNQQIATALSILSTAAGALVILLNGEWPYATAGVGAGLAIYYMVQVWSTWRAWQALARQVDFERERQDGRVTLETAARIGLTPASPDAPFVVPHVFAVEGAGELATTVVSQRRRLTWAMRHPRGGPAPTTYV
jgi:hypothetical protein